MIEKVLGAYQRRQPDLDQLYCVTGVTHAKLSEP
jgi:hypothetical protein